MPVTRRRQLRTARLLAGASALTVPALLVATAGVPAAGADPSTFFGTAGADGTRVSYSITGFLIVDNPVDSATVTAQASVSDLDSNGLAAAPEPGSTVRSVPGTAAGFAPVALPPTPGYPLAASSSSGQPSASFAQGPIQLAAHSTPESSDATAAAAGASLNGVTLGSVTATATTEQEPGTGVVKSSSASDTQPCTFAGVLTISHTHATASAMGTGDGGPAASESSFEADGITVAGQSVRVTPAGLELPGAGAPLPSDDPIAAVLRAANLTVTYLAPIKSAHGVTSAGLIVQQSEAIPNSPNPGVLTVTFGRADAYATGGGASAISSAGGGSSESSVAPSASSSSPFAVSPGSPVSPAPTAAGGGSLPMPSASPPVRSTNAGPGSVVSTLGDTRPASHSVATGRIASRRRSRPQTSSASFYLVLVLAAAAVLVSGKGIRMFAVKLAWT